jgi:hypothetical protein
LGTKAVVVAKNKNQALVAEVRVQGKLDERVCAPGVLLYTLDTTVPSMQGPIRVLDSRPSSGGCGVNNFAELNDGTLSLTGPVQSYHSPEFNVTVTVIDQVNDNYTVRVEYAGN